MVHSSKLGKGKRINNVEDVLTLGQEIEVIVEEIDEKGKVSLTPGPSWNPFPNSNGDVSPAAPAAGGDPVPAGEVHTSQEDDQPRHGDSVSRR